MSEDSKSNSDDRDSRHNDTSSKSDKTDKSDKSDSDSDSDDDDKNRPRSPPRLSSYCYIPNTSADCSASVWRTDSRAATTITASTPSATEEHCVDSTPDHSQSVGNPPCGSMQSDGASRWPTPPASPL